MEETSFLRYGFRLQGQEQNVFRTVLTLMDQVVKEVIISKQETELEGLPPIITHQA